VNAGAYFNGHVALVDDYEFYTFNHAHSGAVTINQRKKKQRCGDSPAEPFINAGADNTGPLFSLHNSTLLSPGTLIVHTTENLAQEMLHAMAAVFFADFLFGGIKRKPGGCRAQRLRFCFFAVKLDSFHPVTLDEN
jgi:hypothetical protein